MLPLPKFSLDVPDRVEDVVAAVACGARILAGGTDLLPSMKHRLFEPERLVSLRRVAEVHEVREEEGGVSIGAAVTLRDVAIDPRLARWPALVSACRTVATPTIQNRATLGGNVMLDTRCLFYNQPAGWRASIDGCLKKDGTVCHVAPKGRGCYATQSADTVPALWLYEATLEFHGPGGARRVPLAELYLDEGRAWTATRADEVLTRIFLPDRGHRVAHRKLRTRAAIDYAQVLVAVRQGPEWAAVVGAVATRPVFVTGTAETLADAAKDACQPLATHLPPAPWRKKMVRVEVSRAVATLTES